MIGEYELRARLRHVRWIGGGSGAGKTTIAHRLAERYGLRVYSTDDAMADHGRRCTPAAGPLLTAFRAMSMDERWVERPPDEMLDTFHWFAGEGFHLVLEDLLDLPADRGVIAEGFRLLPPFVAACLATPTAALWLLPTPAFRVAAFGSRGTLWSIAGRTSDPPRALRNLLERDRLFTDRLRDDVASAGLSAIAVDPSISEKELADRVALSLGLILRPAGQGAAIAVGPMDRKREAHP